MCICEICKEHRRLEEESRKAAERLVPDLLAEDMPASIETFYNVRQALTKFEMRNTSTLLKHRFVGIEFAQTADGTYFVRSEIEALPDQASG